MANHSNDSAKLILLAEELAAYDVTNLRIAGDKQLSERSTPRLSGEGLIAELAKHPEPRVRASLIPLFLRRPELHHSVPKVVDDLDVESAHTLRHFYTAAVYLQHLWRSSLSIYLGDFEILPDYYGQSIYHLPSLQHHFGEAGLRRLAAHFQQETGIDWLTTYDAAMTRFLAQQSLASARPAHD